MGVDIVIAFIAGILSFLSPCILPLIPAFIAYLTGSAVNGDTKGHSAKREAFINSIFFAAGLVIVFTALGILLNGVLSGISFELKNIVSQIGGLIIIFFGLVILKIVRIDFLETPHKFKVQRTSNAYLSSFIFGASFAAGWTPCVGAILGAILTLAITNPASATPLLLSYSIGLSLPFILSSLAIDQIKEIIKRHENALMYINWIAGILLIILGILVLTGQINKFSGIYILPNPVENFGIS